MENATFFQRARLMGNPRANTASTVVCDTVRFTILTRRLVRLEWSPSGEFTDLATIAFPHRYVEHPTPFHVQQDREQDGEYVRVDTGDMQIAYRLGSGAFTSENLTITFHMGNVRHTWRPGQQDSANLGGTRRTLDETGGAVPLQPGMISRDGWAIVDDSHSVVLRPDNDWVGARPPQSEQDWYFFGYGHAYADALADYVLFGGAAPLIPRYALGVWWSRYWPYTAADLERLVDEFAAHALPLDVLVVDMDWHLPGHWTGYSWNHELFPQPEAFFAAMHARGLRVSLNLHPADGVHPHETAYRDFATAMGMADTDNTPIPFRIADRQFAELYFTLLHHPLEAQGVDFWWIDWQHGEHSDIAGLDPLIWLNHLHFADAHRRGERPLLFSRWGGLGNHRYPMGFSGDTFSGWATLAALPHFTATAANVAFGWWSHDIGGHFGAVEEELFVRWVQFGALSPCLRLHASNHPRAERRPWAFSTKALNAVRHAFELRYQLMPYIYTMARHMHERGIALCRPMYYAYPENEDAYNAPGQYQLGDDLIAAPITQPADAHTGLASVDVWIPPGSWYRFDTGEAFAGPRWIRCDGDLETIPLFARAGAVIPLAQPALHLVNVANDTLDIRIFPGADGAFHLYEDDGVSEEYLRDAYEWTWLTSATHDEHTQVFRIAPVVGHCSSLPATRAYRLTFIRADRPLAVTDGQGKPLIWSFDQQAHLLHVTLPHTPKQEAVEVIMRQAAQEQAPSHLSGAPSAPFAHIIAATASDDAQRQLARLIIVPPYTPDAEPMACDATVVWQESSFAGSTVVEQQVAALDKETTLVAPFALDAQRQPQRWAVETRIATDGQEVTAIYTGPSIHPPIQRWRIRYAGQEEWRVVQPEGPAYLTITEPYSVQLTVSAGTSAEAVAVIALAEPTSIWLDAWTHGGMSLAIDGMEPHGSEPRTTIADLERPWPITRYGPITLAAGIREVTVRLTAPTMGAWFFGVSLVGPNGKPLERCMYVDAE